MKKVLFTVIALIIFLLLLQFGPNGLYHREQAINAEIAKARGLTAQTETLPAPTPVASSTDSTATPAPTVAPSIDTNTGTPTTAAAPSTPKPSEPAPAAPAPTPAVPAAAPEVVQSTPPPAPAPTPAATPTPAPETPATTPEPVVAAAPRPPEPAPAAAPVAAPTPAPVVPTQPLPAPTTTVTTATTSTPTATASTAAVVAAASVPAVPVKKAKLSGSKVVILGYYRFSDLGATNTNPNRLSSETFAKQIAWLHDNGFEILALSDLIGRLKSGSPLPEHAAVITINNGYNNALTVAAPVLRQYNYPWSFLVYTDFIEQSPKSVTWTNLLDLSQNKVEIGSQTKSHPWLAETAGKSAEQYDKWLTNELTGSRRILEIKLKKPVTVLAYPYGNSNPTVEKKALALGYEAMLGISGEPITASTSPLNLGRLIINQYTSPYFETILSQKDFTVSNTQPAMGTQIREARPVISAKLNYAGKINPKSVTAELSTGGNFKNIYDPATQTVTFPTAKNLLEGPVFVLIKAKDQDTGKPIVVYWQFYYAPPKAT
ncbi:MAG: hypothetical protein B9S32_11815 [Verrucomicrobia bacterium Tous-C9LFEB]|nr:MAG: hypothetical protein B9S32_11815 [Verrucomicrobia bacterium Tous-C9LFEB]